MDSLNPLWIYLIHIPTHSTNIHHESGLTYIQHKPHKHNPAEKLQPCQMQTETSSLSTVPVSTCVSEPASSTSSMAANAEQRLQPPDNKYLEARWDEDGHM